MGLKIQPTRRIGSKITTLIAVFALVMQPMYGLVASQVANAVSGTDVELQKAVDSAAPGSTVTLTGNVVLAKQLSINKTITIDGAGSYSITANFTRTGNDNDSVIGVYGVANTATLNNLVIDAGGSSRDLHGIDPYVSNVIVNDSTIRNARRAAINANGSEVTINNLITSGNRASTWSYGTIDLAKGDGVTREPKLTINGQSIHNDNGTTHIRRLAGTVVDNNEQYSNAFNIWYTLKSAPTAPSFISPTPAQNSTITNNRNVTISWNNISAANSYEYRIDGGAEVATTTRNFTQDFANGTHTVQVRSVAASGLKGNWNTARTFTVNVNNPAEATITTPATNGIVGTQANGNKLNVKGTFTDDKAVNYLQLELVKDGNLVTSYTMHYNDSGLQPDGNFNINMPVSADLADGQYDLIYTATDFEDGIGPRTNHLFYIDNSAPEVKIAHSTGITHEGTLFNPGVFTISATDQGNPPSGLEVISYSVWKYDPSKGTGPYGNGYHQVASNSNKSDSTVAYDTKDLTDGKYFIGYNAGDKVGNSAGGRVDFTIKSPPAAPDKLSFKMSNGGVRSSGGWANLPKGDVTWNHSNQNDVKSYVYYSWTDIANSKWHEGNKWRTPNITSKNLDGVVFNQGEGKYFFCVAAVDAIGNESKCSDTFEIGYDKTDPMVTIAKPTGPIDTNKEFTIEGTYKDNLSGVGRLHLYASANDKEVVFYVSALNSAPNDEHDYSYKLTPDDLAKLKNDLNLQDGQTLTIKAWAYDKANNSSNTTSTITSDTTAPTAKIESPATATGTFVKTANEMEIKLHATDTVGMRWYDVTVWKKDDPRVQGSSPLASWSHEVPASDSKNWTTSFKLANNLNLPDGEYTIYFTATDLLGRYGNAESVNFTVDSIPPKIEIISATPTLIQGTVGSDATKVLVKIGSNEEKEATIYNGGTWSLVVNPALAVGTHTITARAVDEAGNTNTADTDPIWATSSVEVDTPITETPVINSPQTTTPVTPAAILANLTPTPFIPADNTDATDTDDNGAVAGARTNNNGKDSEKGQVLAAEDAKDSWSLINLLLTIGIGAASIISLLGLLGSSRKDRKLASRLLTIVPAAGAVVALLLIEDFSGSMIWVNIWSLLIGALAVIQMIILGMSKPTTNE